MSDKNQDGWMIVQVLLNHNEARMIPAIALPEGFDSARELGTFTSVLIGRVDRIHVNRVCR